MKLHDKMAMDQLWVRNHSYHDKFSIYKPYGQYFMLFNAPNFQERIEMSYRSIGKKYDWDLEKYRSNKKPSDKGGRRRLLKNFSKFMKNPTGYLMHRYAKYMLRVRFPVVLFTVMTLWSVNNLIWETRQRDSTERYIQSLGGTPEKSSFQFNLHRDGGRGLNTFSFFKVMYNKPRSENLVVNPTYRQNYRLYFDRMDYKA